MTVEFELAGQRSLNGGPQFKFAEPICFSVDCKTQEEVDAYWVTRSRYYWNFDEG
jgi:predicted 3-demethylubiquinone-9 3-methyltransferase (glyoxalase superfamily)